MIAVKIHATEEDSLFSLSLSKKKDILLLSLSGLRPHTGQGRKGVL